MGLTADRISDLVQDIETRMTSKLITKTFSTAGSTVPGMQNMRCMCSGHPVINIAWV